MVRFNISAAASNLDSGLTKKLKRRFHGQRTRAQSSGPPP